MPAPTPSPAATELLRNAPVRIAPETFVIQATFGEGEGPLAVHMNSLLIRGAEPIVVDTGAPIHRETFLEDLFTLVDPQDVRWVFVSHDDADHYGNAEAVMEACPQATLVSTWFLSTRLRADGFAIPPTRWRWVADGETLDVGDRVLAAVRPPVYDSPTTRGLYDPTTGVYWASDCYATPVARSTAYVEDLDPQDWAHGFTAFQTWNSPWLSIVDEAAFGRSCARVEELDVTTIATAHGPTIRGAQVADALRMTRGLPTVDVPPQPGQPLLDEIVAGFTA